MLISQLPPEANTLTKERDGPHWSLEAHLLDDVRMWLMVVAGADTKHVKPHPQRPVTKRAIDPARQKKLIDARKRLRERKRAIEAGEIT